MSFCENIFVDYFTISVSAIVCFNLDLELLCFNLFCFRVGILTFLHINFQELDKMSFWLIFAIAISFSNLVLPIICWLFHLVIFYSWWAWVVHSSLGSPLFTSFSSSSSTCHFLKLFFFDFTLLEFCCMILCKLLICTFYK
jgi:hypothetical protein